MGTWTGRGGGCQRSAAEREWAAPRCGRRGGGEEGGRVEQGREAEEGPSHEGAEAGARGEVPVELQGVQRLSARSSALGTGECGGFQICEHGRIRSTCKECGGSQLEHGRERRKCKECGGLNLRARS